MGNNEVTEADAFDSQILERMDHDHIPDIRRSERNEWFYNNIWRDPQYLKMTIQEDLKVFLKYLKPESKVLEIIRKNSTLPANYSLRYKWTIEDIGEKI